MKVMLALAVGYALGTRAGGKDLDRLGRALQDLYASEELADVASAARAQLASTLRSVADLFDADGAADAERGDTVIAHVRQLMERD